MGPSVRSPQSGIDPGLRQGGVLLEGYPNQLYQPLGAHRGCKQVPELDVARLDRTLCLAGCRGVVRGHQTDLLGIRRGVQAPRSPRRLSGLGNSSGAVDRPPRQGLSTATTTTSPSEDRSWAPYVRGVRQDPEVARVKGLSLRRIALTLREPTSDGENAWWQGSTTSESCSTKTIRSSSSAVPGWSLTAARCLSLPTRSTINPFLSLIFSIPIFWVPGTESTRCFRPPPRAQSRERLSFLFQQDPPTNASPGRPLRLPPHRSTFDEILGRHHLPSRNAHMLGFWPIMEPPPGSDPLSRRDH